MFTHCADRIATLYWVDLAGAATGAVFALLLLQLLNGPMIHYAPDFLLAERSAEAASAKK